MFRRHLGGAEEIKRIALHCALETIINKLGLKNFLLDKKELSMTFIRGGIVNKKK